MSQVKFKSNQEALSHYKNEVLKIEKLTGRDFEDLFLEAEQSFEVKPLFEEVLSLKRNLDMCNHLVKKKVG